MIWKVMSCKSAEKKIVSGRGAEQTTNLRETISSGRIIKSESQQTYPCLPFFIFSPLFHFPQCHPSIPEKSSFFFYFPLPLNFLHFVIQFFYSLPTLSFLFQGNYFLLSFSLSTGVEVMVKPKQAKGGQKE